jgi:hypothetical protein
MTNLLSKTGDVDRNSDNATQVRLSYSNKSDRWTVSFNAGVQLSKKEADLIAECIRSELKLPNSLDKVEKLDHEKTREVDIEQFRQNPVIYSDAPSLDYNFDIELLENHCIVEIISKEKLIILESLF